MDGQPEGFPRATTRGGDVDILTGSAQLGMQLRALTLDFFRAAKATYEVRVIDVSGPNRTSSPFRLRLHAKSHARPLVFQIHLSWEWYGYAQEEIEQVMQRRVRRADCDWVVDAADDQRLRRAECLDKPNKTACVTLARGRSEA